MTVGWDFLFLNQEYSFQPVTQSAISIWGQSFRQSSFFCFALLLLHGPFFLLSWRGPSICWWITSVCLYFELVSSSLCGSMACKFPSSRPGVRSCRLIIEDISSFPPLSVSGKNSRRGSDILVWCRAKPRIRCALDASVSMAYVFHHLSSKSGDIGWRRQVSSSLRGRFYSDFPFRIGAVAK